MNALGSLAAAERVYRKKATAAESARDYRNEQVRKALVDGHTHAAISQATGLSRGRISQIAKAPPLSLSRRRQPPIRKGAQTNR